MSRLLVVVDMQNDFIDGSLGTKEAVAIVPNVVKKIEEYEAGQDEVIFTMDTHFDDYPDTLEGKKLPVLHCIKGSDGWKLQKDIDKFDGKRFEKYTFGSKDCAAYAAEGDYETIELVGLCTDICVISNALLMKAYLPQTPISVDSSCCAGVTPESHENALRAMQSCQIDIS